MLLIISASDLRTAIEANADASRHHSKGRHEAAALTIAKDIGIKNNELFCCTPFEDTPAAQLTAMIKRLPAVA